MDNLGFVKLHRKIQDWAWYKDAKTAHLFIHCLLRANHKDTEWLDITLKRGSFVTSLAHLSEETGLTVSEVRTALKRLESAKSLTKSSSSKNTIITIVNYDTYQSYDKDLDKQIANKSQTNRKQIATDKNDKNDKNEKNISFDVNEFFGSDFGEE